MVATLVVALVLSAEAGLVIGVFLPSSSLVVGLGVLAGGDLLLMLVAALSAAAATVLGAAQGHRRARRRLPRPGPAGHPDVLVPAGQVG